MVKLLQNFYVIRKKLYVWAHVHGYVCTTQYPFNVARRVVFWVVALSVANYQFSNCFELLIVSQGLDGSWFEPSPVAVAALELTAKRLEVGSFSKT
jgi:hypothetical protein